MADLRVNRSRVPGVHGVRATVFTVVLALMAASCGGGDGEGGRPEGEVSWPFSTGGRVLHVPDVIDDLVLLEVQLGRGASETGAVIAVDRSSGEEQWRYQAPGEARLIRARSGVAPFDGPPLVLRDMVIIASAAPDGAGTLTAHPLDGSDEEWSVPTGNGSGPPLASGNDDRIVFRQSAADAGTDDRVVAVETKSGKEKWESDEATVGEPVVVGDDVVYETVDGDTVIVEAGDGDGRFIARKRAFRGAVSEVYVLRDVGGDLVGLSSEELQEQWRTSTPAATCDVGVLEADDELIVISSECSDDRIAVLAIDPELGTVEPIVAISAGQVEQVLVDEQVMVVTTSSLGGGSRVTVVDLEERDELWRRDSDQVFVNVALDDRSVYLVDDDRHLVALDRETGEERWSIDEQALTLVPVVVDGVVYVSVSTGRAPAGASGVEPAQLRAFDANDGDERWSLDISGSAVIVADRGRLYVADGEGVVRAVT